MSDWVVGPIELPELVGTYVNAEVTQSKAVLLTAWDPLSEQCLLTREQARALAYRLLAATELGVADE